jgi:hypothetical protein
MSIEWFCGFENNSLREFDNYSNSSIAASKTGMSGQYCLSLATTNGSAVKNVSARADYYVGLRYYVSTSNTFPACIFVWRNGSTVLGYLRKNTSHYIEYYNGGVIATSINSVSTDTVYLIETYINISDSGSCVVKVNGSTEINYSGDTKPGAATTIDNFYFGTMGTSGYAYGLIDDIVIRTDSFTGDVRVGGKTVNGNSGSPQWTASTGDNWDCLNDIDDADYVYTNTNDNLDLYTLNNVTEAIAVVQALKVSASARKQGVSTPQNLKIACQSGSYLSGSKALSTSFGVNLSNIWEGDPADSDAAWTETKLNDLVVGIKAVA